MAQKDKNGLTAKQEAYAQARADGLTQRQAYMKAYDDNGGLDTTKDVNACKLDSNAKVAQRIEQLRQRTRDGAVLDRDSITAMLSDMASDESNAKGTRLKALDMLNRMQASYTERKDITVNGLTRDDRKQAMQAQLQALQDTWE